MPLDQTTSIITHESNSSTRMCTRYNVRCPSNCNGWSYPCVDDDTFEDDLGTAKAITWAIITSACAWAIIVWWYIA